MAHSKAFVWTNRALRVVIAVILLQTLFFKFTAAPESVYIFSTLGMEPWGRIGSGIFELIASILLLVPATVPLGALMALAATGSAILFHLTRLGIALTAVGDHGELFALAVLVVICSSILLRPFVTQAVRSLPAGRRDPGQEMPGRSRQDPAR
jgi:putative oxidoreductase